MEFSKLVNGLDDEIFAALNDRKVELEAEGKTIYNLSVGTPDFPTPPHIREALIDAAKDPASWKYTLRDMPETLEAVVNYYHDRYHVDITPDMVTSCNGSQDKEHNFLPYVKDIPEDAARRAKYMVVSLPSNPTGSVGTPEVYEEIIAFAKKYDILIVHDNAYSDIVFDGVTCGSFLQYEGAMDIGVEFFSLSKSFNVTGARLSFLVGRKDVVAAFRKLHSQTDFGMFYPLQKAAVAALTGPRDMVKEQCALYQERRDALCGGLRSIGWDCPDSHGTLFVWAPIPASYTSSMNFCLDLMEKAGVICTPGSSFGPLGEGYVRFALVLPPARIKEAVQAIAHSGILSSH